MSWPGIFRRSGTRAWCWLTVCAGLSGCGGGAQPAAPAAGIPAALRAQARPIGAGPRFRPPPRGPLPGRCEASLGPRFAVHVEVFAANQVVLIPAGIGRSHGCYGSLVTLDPTGVVLVRPGPAPRLGDLFRAWGQPLSQRRLAWFGTPPAHRVRAFVDGRSWPGDAAAVRLTPHAEIVVEVGPYVPPHAAYTFPSDQ